MIEQDPKKRAEALSVIDLWRESGLSQNAFCRKEGIHRSTFQHWRRRYDDSYNYKGKNKTYSTHKSKESFITVKVDSPVLENTYDLEIIYTNDVRIKCPSGIGVKELQKLISLEI